jgi:sugar lactone lactonase YvrE
VILSQTINKLLLLFIVFFFNFALSACSGGNTASVSNTTTSDGLSIFAGDLGGIGNVDGTGTAARFNYTASVASDSAGNLYIADVNNNTIRKVTTSGVVSTLAGLAGNSGSADGTGSSARFNSPIGMAIDSAGNVFVADYYNYTIRKITPTGDVTTFAGLAGSHGSTDGTDSVARFFYPYGVAMDSADNLYVSDSGNRTIRKISPTGVVSTLAGSAGSSGSTDGTGNAALFNLPAGVAVDIADNVYVADTSNNNIRVITPAGMVSTLAGLAGSTGSANGTGTAARFNFPTGVTTDSAKNVYVSDTKNHTIRMITPAGLVSTFAGLTGNSGSTDGTGTSSLSGLTVRPLTLPDLGCL